jgi:hypothetical protein
MYCAPTRAKSKAKEQRVAPRPHTQRRRVGTRQKENQDGGVKLPLRGVRQAAEWQMGAMRTLFVPQGLQGIGAHGAASGKVGGSEGDRGQDGY